MVANVINVAMEGLMNAHVRVKKDKKTLRASGKVLEGVGMITFDHDMRKHSVKSDIEALRSDWAKVQSDLLRAWKDASVG